MRRAFDRRAPLRLRNTYCHVFRVADGKIREVTEYMDTELVTAVFAS